LKRRSGNLKLFFHDRTFLHLRHPHLQPRKAPKHTLEAVLDQSLTDFELVIFDNASTDGTRDLIASYQDRRIIYYRQTENVGPGEKLLWHRRSCTR
jgi:hypothetical protein